MPRAKLYGKNARDGYVCAEARKYGEGDCVYQNANAR